MSIAITVFNFKLIGPD